MTAALPGILPPTLPIEAERAPSRRVFVAAVEGSKSAGGNDVTVLAKAPEEAAPRAPGKPPNGFEVDIRIAPEIKLRVRLDEASGRFVYLAINAESGEVERQYPTDEALRMIARIRKIAGLTVDKTL